ncbi:MAG: hypothetical protein GQ564_15505 [Bacteroidales bacterium]|nr:hypothetical protein [Bacteroidales bacterium]
MTQKLQYLILEDKSMIIVYCKGKVFIDEVIEFKKKMGNDKNYSPNFNVIYDFRELEFLFELEELSRYVEFISNNKKYIGNRKSAVITNSPNQVVIGIGFDILKNKLPIEVQVCSTVETAFSFLGLPIKDWEFIESLICELRNTQEH